MLNLPFFLGWIWVRSTVIKVIRQIFWWWYSYFVHGRPWNWNICLFEGKIFFFRMKKLDINDQDSYGHYVVYNVFSRSMRCLEDVDVQKTLKRLQNKVLVKWKWQSRWRISWHSNYTLYLFIFIILFIWSRSHMSTCIAYQIKIRWF